MTAIKLYLKSFSSITLIAGFIIFSLSCSTNTSGEKEMKLPTQEEAKTAILTKINMANEKWASGDPLGFVDCASPEITWIDDLGALLPVKGKDALKAYLDGFTGKIPPHEHELSNFNFQFYEDIVIITYRYTGTFDGEPADPWKVTSVYKYQDGDWWSIHENWSVVKNKS